MKQTPLVIIAGCLIVAIASLGIFYYSTTPSQTDAPISEPVVAPEPEPQETAADQETGSAAPEARLRLIRQQQILLQAKLKPSLRQQPKPK